MNRYRVAYRGGPRDGDYRDSTGPPADRLEVLRLESGEIASEYYRRAEVLGHVDDDPEHPVHAYDFVESEPARPEDVPWTEAVVDELAANHLTIAEVQRVLQDLLEERVQAIAPYVSDEVEVFISIEAMKAE